MKKNNINELIRVMENLEGENYDKNIMFTIKTSDILKSLKPYEITDYIVENYNEESDEYEEIELQDKEEYINYFIDNGYIDINKSKCKNTYNWSANITNDIYFSIDYNDLYDNILVELKVHLYGDIRGNYTDTILLQFDNENEFFDVLTENYITNTIVVNGNTYNLYCNFFNEGIDVVNNTTNKDFTIYEYEYKYIENEIKENDI